MGIVSITDNSNYSGYVRGATSITNATSADTKSSFAYYSYNSEMSADSPSSQSEETYTSTSHIVTQIEYDSQYPVKWVEDVEVPIKVKSQSEVPYVSNVIQNLTVNWTYRISSNSVVNLAETRTSRGTSGHADNRDEYTYTASTCRVFHYPSNTISFSWSNTDTDIALGSPLVTGSFYYNGSLATSSSTDFASQSSVFLVKTNYNQNVEASAELAFTAFNEVYHCGFPVSTGTEFNPGYTTFVSHNGTNKSYTKFFTEGKEEIVANGVVNVNYTKPATSWEEYYVDSVEIQHVDKESVGHSYFYTPYEYDGVITITI